MILESIKVRRLPGIDIDFQIDGLSDGMNVISGPNGAGKTSLCHAITTCLWEACGKGEGIEADAVWRMGEERWTAVRRGDVLSWERNGKSAAGPDLPASHYENCFHLRIEDLLPITRPGTTDADLTRIIAREMTGGYQLDLLRPRFETKGSRSFKVDLVKANKDVKAAQSVQKAGAEDEESLPGLVSGRDAAARARNLLPHLQTAQNLCGLRAELAKLKEQKQALPNLTMFSEGDDGRYADLLRSLNETQNEIIDVQRSLAELQETIARCALPGNKALDPLLLQQWEGRLNALVQLEGHQRILADSAAQAQAVLIDAQQNLTGQPLDTAVNVSPAAITAARDLLDRDLIRDSQRSALDQLLRWLPTQTTVLGMEGLVKGMDVLVRRLALADAPGPSLGTSVPSRLPALLACMAGAVSLVASLMAFAMHQVPVGVAALIAFVIGIAAVLVIFRSSSPPTAPVPNAATEAASRQKELAEDYARLGLPDVMTGWSRRECQAMLEQLSARLADERCAEKFAEVRRGAENQRQNIGETLAQRNERQALRAQTGLDLSWRDFDKVWLLHLLCAYWDARRQWQEKTAQHEAKAEAIRQELGEFAGQFAAELSQAPADTVHAARLAWNGLSERSHDLAHALEEQRKEQSRLDALCGRALENSARVADFLRDRCCADTVEFQRKLSDLPAWLRVCRAADELAVLISADEKALQPYTELLGLDLDAVKAQMEKESAVADGYDELLSRIVAIEHEVKTMKGSHSITDALDRQRECQDSLDEGRKRALRNAAGRFLLARTEKAFESSHSGILTAARDLFQQFTKMAYQLRLATDGSNSLLAYETDAARSVALSQLSGGARVQMLMAVRIAFARTHLSSAALPLWLDEALKHSDPSRYEAIVSCLSDLSGQGQQIFYLTNEPTDVPRICAVFARAGAPEPRHIDLQRIRQGQAAWADITWTEMTLSPEVVAPDGHTPEQYAKLINVERFRPDGPSASVPLFYLLSDDLPLLHTLLTAGVERIGRWRTVSPEHHDRIGINPTCAASLTLRAELTEKFLANWRIGRYLPLTREAIHQSGMSSHFLDKTWAMAQELGCDARKLLVAIEAHQDERVYGFRQNRVPTIRLWLEEHGYASSQNQLGKNDIFSSLISDDVLKNMPVNDLRHWVNTLWHYAESNNNYYR